MNSALVKTDDKMMLVVLENSLYPGANPASIGLVLEYCRASGLDPMQKPVHIVPMWDSKAGRMRDVVMPGVGLYRTQAARTGQYAGVSDPEYGPDVTETIGGTAITYPTWCKVTVKRLMPNGVIVDFSATERWKENYAIKGGKDKSVAPNAMWLKRPYGQIAKCAEAQALRKAFPEMTGAMPTADEMEGKEYDQSIDQAAQSIKTERNPQAAATANAPAGADEYEQANLPAMREAAMNGSEALAAAFAALPKGPHKAGFWATHKAALKLASEGATVIDAETGEVV